MALLKFSLFLLEINESRAMSSVQTFAGSHLFDAMMLLSDVNNMLFCLSVKLKHVYELL